MCARVCFNFNIIFNDECARARAVYYNTYKSGGNQFLSSLHSLHRPIIFHCCVCVCTFTPRERSITFLNYTSATLAYESAAPNVCVSALQQHQIHKIYCLRKKNGRWFKKKKVQKFHLAISFDTRICVLVCILHARDNGHLPKRAESWLDRIRVFFSAMVYIYRRLSYWRNLHKRLIYPQSSRESESCRGWKEYRNPKRRVLREGEEEREQMFSDPVRTHERERREYIHTREEGAKVLADGGESLRRIAPIPRAQLLPYRCAPQGLAACASTRVDKRQCVRRHEKVLVCACACDR